MDHPSYEELQAMARDELMFDSATAATNHDDYESHVVKGCDSDCQERFEKIQEAMRVTIGSHLDA